MNILLHISQKTNEIGINKEFMSTLETGLSEVQGVNVKKDNSSILSVDIIHIFGAWDISAYRLAMKANKLMIPFVYTPLGELEPWIIRKNLIKRNIQLLTYQRYIMKSASAIHVFGELELNSIRKLRLGIDKNIKIIKNPVLTSAITNGQMIKEMFALYQEATEKHDEKIKEQIRKKTERLNEKDTTISGLLYNIYYIKYLYGRGMLTSNMLDTLSYMMTNGDYDEDIMKDLLKRANLLPFASRLFQVMSETSALTEGFIPIIIINDKQTDVIRKNIINT